MLRKCSISCLLVLCLLFASSALCEGNSADKEPMPTKYSYATNLRCMLAVSGGTADCLGKANSRDTTTQTKIVVTLQKRVDENAPWLFVCSWTDTKSGTATAYVAEQRAVSSGYDYRVRLQWYIKDASGHTLESGTLYSPVHTY